MIKKPKLSKRIFKFIFIGALVALIIDVSILYYLSYELKDIFSKNGFNFVKPIEYDKSKWYDQERSALWNLERSDYVFPNDRLNYIVLLDSKLPYQINIASDMQIFVGDKNVTSTQILPYVLHLSPNHRTDGIGYNFTAHEGGLNTVKVNLKIINATNNVSLENKTEILKFDVQSQAIQLQVEANRNTFLGVILSTIAAFASISFLAYQTRMLRKEKNQTLRAWIGEADSKILPMRYFNQKNEIITHEEWEKMTIEEQKKFLLSKVEVALTLKNFGQIPATVWGRYFYIIDKKPSRRDIENIKFGEPFVIMPQGEQLFIFEDTIAIFHTSKGGTAYLIIDLKYKSGDSDDEKKYGVLVELTRGGYKTKETWNEKTF